MRYNRPLHVAFFFLSTILLAAPAATARADDEYVDEYRETARVARISLLRGDVILQRAGTSDWEQASLNLPLVEGDTLTTALDARLEIQIDARNFVRVGEDSVLQIVTLRDEGITLSLAEGTATLRLARFERDKEYFEIDAPKTTVAAEQRGLYRLDVQRDGSVRITVRDDGQARVYSETSGFTLRDGRSAQLFYDGAEAGDWELSSAPPRDDWDRWTDERERVLLARLRYEQRDRYYDTDVWGAEELDSYGDWSYASDYGWVWRPSVTYTSNYTDWSPYRHGHWRWCRPYGWTWVGDEPWGWAPYHYGRWVYYNNSWCWAPRGYGYNYGRSRWCPALVVFVLLRDSHRENIAWYPLAHGQRDPVYYRNGKPVPPTAVASDDLPRSQRDPAYLRGVTTLLAEDFGKHGVRARPAPKDLAQRVITTPPVRGSLPIRPVNADPKGKAETNKGDRVIVTTPPAGVRPARQLPPERRTGATTRKPGVALDNELRRTRINKGRAPRSAPDADSEDAKVKTTGAVKRPVPPATRTRVERRVNTDKSVGDDDGAPPVGRPVRQRTPKAQEEERTPSPNVIAQPEGERSRPAPRRVDENKVERPPVERRREERPPVERRSQPPRPDPPKERPSPPAERERPVVRERTPAPREETKQSTRGESKHSPPPSEPARERNAPAQHGKGSAP